MRRAAKIDDNHKEIREFFNKAGANWFDTFQLKNFCDGFIVYQGVTVAVEVKDGKKTPSQQKLSEGEQAFAKRWQEKGGKYAVINSVEQANMLLTTISSYNKQNSG